MKEIIILMGGPGSGKTTVTDRLYKTAKFNRIETGALFRSLPSDSKIAQLIAAGNLVPDFELLKLIKSKINKSENILMDGFPRTLPQARWLIKNYLSDFEIKIIYLAIPEKLMKHRIQYRADNNTQKRSDDTDISAIRLRLDTFQEITMPAINWLRENDDIKFFYIDGAPDINNVIEQISKIK